MRADTRSPGIASDTNTTRPSWCATKTPPWATRSTSSSTTGPSRSGAAGAGRRPARARGLWRRGRRGSAMLRAFHSGSGGRQDGDMLLYLASTSPARLQTLRAAGIEPVAIAPGVDEAAVVAAVEAESGPLEAPDLVQLLAQAKAEAIVGGTHDDEPI